MLSPLTTAFRYVKTASILVTLLGSFSNDAIGRQNNAQNCPPNQNNRHQNTQGNQNCPPKKKTLDLQSGKHRSKATRDNLPSHQSAADADKADPSLDRGDGFMNLPTWEDPEFNSSLDPIWGQQFGEAVVEKEKKNTFAAELGGSLELDNIPLYSGNFSVFLSSHAGAARGSQSLFTSLRPTQFQVGKDKFTSETKLNQRTWYGADTEIVFDAFREKVGIAKGLLAYDEAPESDLESLAKTHRLGIRIKSIFSLWHKFREYRAYLESYDKPLVSELDHFLYVRAAYSTFTLNIGAGVSKIDVFGRSREDREIIGAGVSRSLRLDCLWPIGDSFRFEAYARYAYLADEGLVPAYNAIRLPTQELNAAKLIASAPEDTYTSSIFIGWIDLIEDLTLGYGQNMEIINSSDPENQRTIVNQGPIAEYSYSF